MSDSRMWRAIALVSLHAVLPFSLGGCVDEEKVYGDDRPVVGDPEPAANGFLGYTQATAKLTICGNCHAVPQVEWVGTAHADAWETLREDSGVVSSCEGCHTVSEFGNAVTGESGWTATGDARYHDVQCESCHGPGQQHVMAPNVTQPIASIAVIGENGAYVSCAECHNGTHHPFVEQWSLSAHANVGFQATREGCADCHSAQGALTAWGVRADYAEKDGDPLAIVCAVCHDPHDPALAGQLRFPVEGAPSFDTNLCARCHNRRSVPDPASSHGLEPHSPETPQLIGEAGWFPAGAGFAPGTLIGTHGQLVNERQCAACHVEPYAVEDPVTGDSLQAVGHTFRAIPCVDETGIPDGSTGCALTPEARNWQGCTNAGCHGNVESVNLILQARLNQIAPRAEELLALLELVDPNLDEPGGEIDPTNPTFTVAEGAFFNWSLANHGGSLTKATVHNFQLTQAQLDASIRAVEDEYGL